jgi:hypothetical protein
VFLTWLLCAKSRLSGRKPTWISIDCPHEEDRLSLIRALDALIAIADPLGGGHPSETKPPAEAEQALANYIAQKYQPERRRQDIEDIDCADVLSIYLTDVGEPSDQFEIEARIERLNDFWGGKKLLAVSRNGKRVLRAARWPGTCMRKIT